jgi:hypothetical protein
MTEFLNQFHRHPSLHLVAIGRRAGPDGAFAILRAATSSYLDIVFRLHAEFYLTPDDWKSPLRIGAWYTPAYFAGRVIVNRQTGRVDYFRLGIPTEKALNVHLTLAIWHGEVVDRDYHDIVRVERMELTGGNSAAVETIPWGEDALTFTEARRRLARVFYKSQEIDWVPLDQVAARARARQRPIFAVVSWGAFDDQSC